MKQKKARPLWLKWCFAALPLCIASVMYFVLPHFPKFTEYVIARGLFRVVAFPLEWIMSILPFSLTEAVVVLCAPAVLVLAVIFAVRIIKSKERGRTVERGCRFVAWFLSLFTLVFMVMDGANFSRLSAAELLELPNRRYTAEELYTVTCELAKQATLAREELSEDKDGCVKLSMDRGEFLRLADDCYKPLRKEHPFLKTSTWRVKPVLLSHYWSYTGYTGVYCPWLGEASVNIDVPDSSLGHTAAHEVAHTMGFAKENECNFFAWLACAESGQADYKYSGYLDAFIYCANALYRADKELWRAAYKNCSEGIFRDLEQRSEYWKSFEGEVEEASQKFNDTFIKANGVESGVLSYGEMVELVLRFYDKEGMI